jgi:hypothetical protein
LSFSNSKVCLLRVHCVTCRTDRRWRESVAKTYGGEIDFVCPIGKPLNVIPKRQLGDWLSAFFLKLGIKKKANCQCTKRQKYLNERSNWILSGVSAIIFLIFWSI